MAPKGKAVLPPHDASTAPTEQSTYTAEASTLPLLRSVSPPLNIAQLIAEQMTIARNDMARLVAGNSRSGISKNWECSNSPKSYDP